MYNIGPAKQSPDPEEVAERKRPPSLGELLLAEVEAMRIKREAQQAAASSESVDQPLSLQLPQIHATADTYFSKRCTHRARKKHQAHEQIGNRLQWFKSFEFDEQGFRPASIPDILPSSQS